MAYDIYWQSEKEGTLKSMEQSFKKLKSVQEKSENLPGVDELFETVSSFIAYGQDFPPSIFLNQLINR